jgi:hypothetical protein
MHRRRRRLAGISLRAMARTAGQMQGSIYARHVGTLVLLICPWVLVTSRHQTPGHGVAQHYPTQPLPVSTWDLTVEQAYGLDALSINLEYIVLFHRHENFRRQ